MYIEDTAVLHLNSKRKYHHKTTLTLSFVSHCCENNIQQKKLMTIGTLNEKKRYIHRCEYLYLLIDNGVELPTPSSLVSFRASSHLVHFASIFTHYFRTRAFSLVHIWKMV